MILSKNLDALLISFIIASVLILLIIIGTLRFYASKEQKVLGKSCTALIINPNQQIIEMKIPIHDQNENLSEQYTVPIETETLYPSDDLNKDYYQAILSTNEIPYYPVRETNFEVIPKYKSAIVVDLKINNASNQEQIADV